MLILSFWVLSRRLRANIKWVKVSHKLDQKSGDKWRHFGAKWNHFCVLL